MALNAWKSSGTTIAVYGRNNKSEQQQVDFQRGFRTASGPGTVWPEAHWKKDQPSPKTAQY
jgi:hypothetical protein